ncbi:MAG: thermonuclease family protein [Burkholderiaceae bacterium]|nr:thermonuclease family protein [Burkholderiaceae bacterium]
MRAFPRGLIPINDRIGAASAAPPRRSPRLPAWARTSLVRTLATLLALAAAAPLGAAASDAGAAAPGTGAGAPAVVALEGHVVRVLDGDSLLVRIDGRGVRGVRIAGIDAPEKGQPWADVSRRALLEQLDDRDVRIDVIKTDRFDRLVGRVFVARHDAGLAQLRAGLAWHFARYDADLRPAVRRRYAQAERQARLRALGLWRDADPLPPWEHRARARAAGPRPPARPAGAADAR